MTTEVKIEVIELEAKEHQRLLENHQKLERGKKGFNHSLEGKHGPDILILDF